MILLLFNRSNGIVIVDWLSWMNWLWLCWFVILDSLHGFVVIINILFRLRFFSTVQIFDSIDVTIANADTFSVYPRFIINIYIFQWTLNPLQMYWYLHRINWLSLSSLHVVRMQFQESLQMFGRISCKNIRKMKRTNTCGLEMRTILISNYYHRGSRFSLVMTSRSRFYCLDSLWLARSLRCFTPCLRWARSQSCFPLINWHRCYVELSFHESDSFEPNRQSPGSRILLLRNRFDIMGEFVWQNWIFRRLIWSHVSRLYSTFTKYILMSRFLPALSYFLQIYLFPETL
jgi:hypothetical protein